MNLPVDLINSLQSVKGFSREAFEKEHASPEKVTSIRINPYKRSTSSLPLLFPFLERTGIPWCETGYYLSARPSFTPDPFFHAGCYYVQEASSMFLEQVIKAVFPGHEQARLRILDLCAAPGGKTTHLSALFPEGFIVANEVIKTRAGILAENVVRWGKENIIVTSNDPAAFNRLQGYFDLVVADAPCSGSGMFRKDPESIKEWSPQHVDLCSKRQKRIIEDCWPSLKENGIFIYATCSYSVKENEEVLDWIADTFEVDTVSVPHAAANGIVETVSDRNTMYGYRFYPDKIKGEGFFIACMRKKEHIDEQIPDPKRLVMASKQDRNIISPFLTNPEQYELVYTGREIDILKKCNMDDIAALYPVLYIKKPGIRAGKIMKDELIPSHELALSTIIALNLSGIDADPETALEYLRKKDFSADNASKGWNVVRFMGHNLGWVKILPNRINNYYPSALRILKH